MDQSFTVGKVFVPGGLPTVTYNPREELGLEERVREYLNEGHRILSVSGPTKSGKTVLLKSILTDAVWLSGGTLSSMDDFWGAVGDALDVYPNEQTAQGLQEMTGRSTSGEGTIGVAKGGRSASEELTSTRDDSRSRTRPPASVAREALSTNLRVLVIDDFHYVEPALQLQIVRNLKDLVFDGLPVVFAAVPHRAYDAVRVEKEMTGRVEQLEIRFWAIEELLGIASHGFQALNLLDGSSLAARLATESFSSPHLMQDFCLQLCKSNGVSSTVDTPQALQAPARWETFFASRASAASKSAFDLLARGPRQRTDRIERILQNGSRTDIYGAVLAGIAKTGPLTELTYEQLRSALRDVLTSDPPQRHEVTRVLEEMSKIARKEIEGEPVVDYDEELATLYISDPFFAYFLRWGLTDT